MFVSPNRIKALKDLIILKLDILVASSEKLDSFIKNRSAADIADASALENDSSMMEALTFLINRIQESSTVNVEYLAALLGRVERMQQEITLIRMNLKAEYAIEHREYDSVEIDLMVHLYSFVPSRLALDIGANIGDTSKSLLETGYQVIAFEPNPLRFAQLQERLGNQEHLQLHCLSIGHTDMDVGSQAKEGFSSANAYQDPGSTLRNSLAAQSIPEDLPIPEELRLDESVPAKVRSLKSLHSSLKIPSEVGLLKIDAEGFCLEVVRGMGEQRYPVVVTKYRNLETPLIEEKTHNELADLVLEMRDRGYWWHLVIHRDEGKDEVGFYCNSPFAVPNSWGSVFFFQDRAVFSRALDWCSESIPRTDIGKARGAGSPRGSGL